MKKFLAILLTTIFIFSSYNCAYAKKRTQEEKYDIQTHVFETSDYNRVIQAAINTLQDSDFIIEEIDTDLGFIRAQKTFKEKFSNKKRVLGWSTAIAATAAYTAFSYGSTAGYMINPTRRVLYELRDKTVKTDANILIEPCGENKTLVRFSFSEKVLQNADGFSFTTQVPVKIIRIYKPAIYREFFNQIEEKI